jgi:prepilin-type N-terminal cleavage/methylation domain-containing protein
MFAVQPNHRRGFSLIELVIVVVIIGIIGAIAIPRLSRGAEGATDSALVGNLAVLRNAIDLYATEHNGQYPELSTIEAQLTQYTDLSGATSTSKTGDFIYGPYIRKIPAVTVGAQSGSTGFTDEPGTADKGWVYDETTGDLKANTTTEVDASNTAYNTY